MQKVEIITGSPRRSGNSTFLARILSDQLDPKRFRARISYLYDLNISPCTDCRACKRGRSKRCVIDDDMQSLYPRLAVAQIILIATPIYWFGPSAKTKLLLDRLRPFFGNQKLAHKKFGLLLAAGSGAGDCDLTIEMFRRTARALQMEFIGTAITQAYDLGDAEKDMDALPSLIDLAGRIEAG